MQGEPGERESLLRDVSGETQGSLTRRVLPLDVIRGFGVVLMILVTDAAPAFDHALDSAEWDGFGVADAVPAIFLFVLGFSMSLSFARFWDVAKRQHDKPRVFLATRSCARGLVMFIMGLVLEGTGRESVTDVSHSQFYFDLSSLRIPGVLQRLGFVHIVLSLGALLPERTTTFRGDTVLSPVSSISIHADIILRRYQSWFCALAILIIYFCVLFAVKVHECSRGQTTIECNSSRMIDQSFFGSSHLLRNPPYSRSSVCRSMHPPEYCQLPFDPWGVLPSLPAIVATFIGYHYGECSVSARFYSNTNPDSLPYKLWLQPVLPLGIFATILHFAGHRINRSLFSISYLCATSAGCGFVFVCIHFLHSRFQFVQRILSPFAHIGQQSIVVYVFGSCAILESMITCVYWKDRQQNNLVYLFRQRWLINGLGNDWGLVAFAISKVLFWMLISWLMSRYRLLVKV
eukprot:c7679_g1_i2.p1 GENE.c7679_g1_i2~~c7679_g1_i2.p1  ORF type:complete len:460 (+),score=80.39 c7679_g1_i2:88-1467(+)